MFTNYPGVSLIFSLFINLFIILSLTIPLHLFYSHFNLFNKIDIVICNVEQYNDMDLNSKTNFHIVNILFDPYVTT